MPLGFKEIVMFFDVIFFIGYSIAIFSFAFKKEEDLLELLYKAGIIAALAGLYISTFR